MDTIINNFLKYLTGYSWHEKLFTFGLWSSYLFFAFAWLGIYNINPNYLNNLEYYLQIYIAIFLVYTFNPYFKKPISSFAKGIAFSAGLLLITSKILDLFPELQKYKQINL